MANDQLNLRGPCAGGICGGKGLATLSDGPVGGFEASSITFELCRRFVDDWVLVSEDEIRDAMKTIVERHDLLIEGSAAVVVAAALKLGKSLAGQSGALVVSGGNVGPGKLEESVPGNAQA